MSPLLQRLSRPPTFPADVSPTEAPRFDRFTALADLLSTIAPERFSYENFMASPQAEEGLESEVWVDAGTKGHVDVPAICGTTCCAAGYLPLLAPRDWSWRASSSGMVGLARINDEGEDRGLFLRCALAEWFGISEEFAQAIFFDVNELFGSWAPVEVERSAIRIEHMVAIFRLVAARETRTVKDLDRAWQDWGDDTERYELLEMLG